MADKVKVRTKMRPDEEIELKGGERERLDLQRMGLVYEGSATTDEGARRAVERQQADAPKRKTAAPRKRTAKAAVKPAEQTTPADTSSAPDATPQEG